MECLRLNKLDVPPAIYQGSPVLLHCDFDVEGDALYSVKWYKDYVEFYRYIPSELRSKGRKFHSKGVFVDLSVSNDTHVFLSKTDGDSEGMYACEVSSEFPSFITIRVERQMKVYVLPQESLQIEGIHENVITRNVGEVINLTCVSGASRPRVRLTWFINEQMAQPHQVLRYSPQVYSNGLQSTRLGLTFLANADHFNKGLLMLRCSATVVLAYKFETSLQLIGGQRPKQSHEASVVREEEAPTIVGSKSWYAVEEPMDLNCTTNTRDSLLRWYINEDEAKSEDLTEFDGEKRTLNLKLLMRKSFFQLPELKLKCVSIHFRTIANFQKKLSIVNSNKEVIHAQSAINGNRNVEVKVHSDRCLIYIFVVLNYLLQ